MRGLLAALKEITRYPSAMVGLFILAFILALAAYAVITIPYGEAIRLWRGGEATWRYNPRTAAPVWIDYLTPKKLLRTVILGPEDAQKEVKVLSERTRRLIFTYTLNYEADVFPSELAVVFKSQYEKKPPRVEVIWRTPDGREFSFGRQIPSGKVHWYTVSQDRDLIASLRGAPEKVLFQDPDAPEKTLKGSHTITIKAYVFEPEADLEAEVVVYGTVYGIAGTDHLRRDIWVALLWGAPIALAFGLGASFGITISSIVFAAIGAWFGGWVDAVVQRLTEIRMVIPTLPILIMVGLFYSKSIWVILAVLIVLNLIESSVKQYRAVFLQEKRTPYIEAARSYGARHLRIVFRYLIPRVIPWVIPSFVLAVPAYVFLEASLSVLGLGDPVLPTWGKLLSDAFSHGALYHGYYYWVLEPAFLLMLTGFGFTLIGYTLDKVFNPKLREI